MASDISSLSLTDLFVKWCWRLSGFVLWSWLINAIVIKLGIYNNSFIPNILVLVIVVPFLFAIKDIKKVVIYIAYLIVFIPIVFVWCLKPLFKSIIFLYLTLRFVGKSIYIITSNWFFFILLALIVLLNLETILFPDRFPIIKSVGHIILTTLLVFSVARWVYNPLKPVKILKEAAIKYGKKAWSFTFERDTEKVIKNGSSDKIEAKLNEYISEKSNLQLKLAELSENHYRLTAKKTTVLLLPVALLLLFLGIVFGYGGCIYLLNNMGNDIYAANLLTETGLIFNSLPKTASYSDCIFHSFTIMTTLQSFSILDTALLARILIVGGLLTTIFLLTIIVAVFFGVIGIENDFDFINEKSLCIKMINKYDKMIGKLTDLK